jgi:hypothetical protein
MKRDDGAALSRLLWVLVGLVAGGTAFALVTKKRRRGAEESRTEEGQATDGHRAKEERAVESDRASEAVLQAYFDRICELLLKHDLAESVKGDSVMDVARARTLTVLRQLDGERKGLLLRFLYESELESDLIGRLAEPEGKEGQRAIVAAPHGANILRVYSAGADLRGAQLVSASLMGADLRGANLTGACLRGADLRSAKLAGTRLVAVDMEGAKLVAASLKDADLRGAKLAGAEMTRAYLTGANLVGADLSDTELTGAYLASVDLSGAKVADVQLAQARSLEGATLTDGTVHR